MESMLESSCFEGPTVCYRLHFYHVWKPRYCFFFFFPMIFGVECFVDDMTMEGKGSTHHSQSVQDVDRPLKIAGGKDKTS